jgi:hypothetical protein
MQQKARALWQEYRKEVPFYSRSRRNGFAQRVRNLARKLDWSAGSGDLAACMYLDSVAVYMELVIGGAA